MTRTSEPENAESRAERTLGGQRTPAQPNPEHARQNHGHGRNAADHEGTAPNRPVIGKHQRFVGAHQDEQWIAVQLPKADDLNTVIKLLEDAGEAFSDYQDRTLRGLTCKRIQVDEIWAFVYAKAKNVKTAKTAPEDAGDCWTWLAIDADTKLIPSFYVGNRDSEAAQHFIGDLALRLAHRVQLTSDGHKPYLEAIEQSFGADIDYAMLVKIYGDTPGQGRYSPGECIGAEKRRVEGHPDMAHVSTSYAERANLTMRMGSRRFTRLTNAFSKKVENHAHSVAVHTMHYNFVRIHQTLRCTPAMAAGVTSKLWELADMVAVLEAWESK